MNKYLYFNSNLKFFITIYVFFIVIKLYDYKKKTHIINILPKKHLCNDTSALIYKKNLYF